MSDLSAIKHIVENTRKALLVSHIAPDGDTLGATLGLAWAFRKQGIEARLSCADPIPKRLAFLPGSEDYAPRGRTDEDVIFLIDVSDLARIGAIYEPTSFSAVPLVNIDHHATNQMYGDVNLVDERTSTAELILDALYYLRIPLDEKIATCLLTGIITDTQGFRTNNTAVESMRAAVELVEAGAPLTKITDAVFNHRPRSVIEMWGHGLSHYEFSDSIVWCAIPREILQRVEPQARSSRGLINFMSSMDGVKVAIVFREFEEGMIDVSFRSVPDIDISVIATRFGGGGHPQAAGCLLRGTLEEITEHIVSAARAITNRQIPNEAR
ncbi:MAG: bifunctional oligoribonuclease/PAP phosphatase NrnA [Chloroflexota bacterium]|nr:bifunctional oligoribonuclease/PAP phosphatase NrnA [Chloroflexota bacterium]